MVSDVNTQIRIPGGLHKYIQSEASRIGITNNAFLIILCELGGRVWDNQCRVDFESHSFKPDQALEE